MKTLKRWTQWLPTAPTKSDRQTLCPSCRAENVSTFRSKEAATKVGWVAFWCNTCLEGIQVSRVKFDDGIQSSDGDFAELTDGVRWVNG